MTQCLSCGTALPQEDARFCANCGMLVPSHPLSPQSLAGAKNSASVQQQEPRQDADAKKTEQPAMDVARSSGKAARALTSEQGKASVPWPAPMTHVSFTEHTPREKEAASIKDEELHIEDLPTTSLEAHHAQPSSTHKQNEIVEGSIADRPTLLLAATSSASSGAGQVTPVPQQRKVIESRPDWQSGSSAPVTPQWPAAPAQQEYIPTTPPIQESPSAGAGMALGSPFIAPPMTPRPARRGPVALVAVLLLLLVLIGLGTWVAVFHPFSVADDTQPLLSFSDTHLGFSLRYPNGWSHQAESGKSIVHFSDSSQTGQFTISFADAANSDVTKALQQQETQLGMTAAKAGDPLSFAGSSWQQVQGTVQQSGANYTGAILATIHGNRLVMITQLAPQSVYAQEESLVFSQMRNDLQLM